VGNAGVEEINPGRRFERYQLLHRFASGGMADLYLARLSGEEGFERIMAVKVIHSHLTQQPEFVKMFIDEARLASRISHPNVALTLDLGRVGPTHFIAMEYVDGESITSVLRRTRPPIPYSMRIISDAAAGLHAAHELRGLDGNPLGVVHRDVSPANILIAYDGTVKVVDFGVARARGSLHTTSGGFKGKFGYMSPEQFAAPQDVDRRTDIFALGVVLYEMTTWARLFKAETEAATVERVLHGEIPPPTRRVPGYPPALERIVTRALSRTPGGRQATAQELHEELEQAIAAIGRSPPAPRWRSTPRS
jgi:serine/threonine-protein kinase